MADTSRYAVIVGYAQDGKPYAGHVLELVDATPEEAAEIRARLDGAYLVACGDQDVIVGDEVDVDEQGYVRGP